ncbi:MAG: hypothetical protein KJ645_09970 [Planctomycetes bacterium]|nr:hypothetical protein [Planctomycetota bacterium]
MKNQKLFLAMLAVLTLIPIGCGSIDPVTGRESLGYFPARFYDFLDIVELNLAIDSTFSLYAMAGLDPFNAGLGLYESQKFGLDGRLFGQWSEDRCGAGFGLESFTRYKKTPNWGNRYLYDADYCPHENTVSDRGRFFETWGFSSSYLDHEKRILDVTAEVHVFAIGIDVGVSILEILDFTTGLLGIDVISDDDWVEPGPDRKVPIFGHEESQED